MSKASDTVLTWEEARLLRERCRAEGLTFVFTNGCFDLLHDGHRHLLRECAKLGDVLVVGLNGDASVARLKGPGRPVNGLDRRIRDLSVLREVDAVVVFEEDTPEDLLRLLRPDILAKGGDYAREEIVGRDLVESAGGRVTTVSFLPGQSTTQRIGRRTRTSS